MSNRLSYLQRRVRQEVSHWMVWYHALFVKLVIIKPKMDKLTANNVKDQNQQYQLAQLKSLTAKVLRDKIFNPMIRVYTHFEQGLAAIAAFFPPLWLSFRNILLSFTLYILSHDAGIYSPQGRHR